MYHDDHSLATHSPEEVEYLLVEQSIPPEPLKKPYIPPKMELLLELNISNNTSGGGDGDAAFAHS